MHEIRITRNSPWKLRGTGRGPPIPATSSPLPPSCPFFHAACFEAGSDVLDPFRTPNIGLFRLGPRSICFLPRYLWEWYDRDGQPKIKVRLLVVSISPVQYCTSIYNTKCKVQNKRKKKTKERQYARKRSEITVHSQADSFAAVLWLCQSVTEFFRSFQQPLWLFSAFTPNLPRERC